MLQSEGVLTLLSPNLFGAGVKIFREAEKAGLKVGLSKAKSNKDKGVFFILDAQAKPHFQDKAGAELVAKCCDGNVLVDAKNMTITVAEKAKPKKTD